MKKYYSIIILSLFAVLAVSCGNNGNKTKDGSATKTRAEVAKEGKELADDALSFIDSVAIVFKDELSAGGDEMDVVLSALSEEQKLVKPDYLLNPEIVKDLTSHRQRTNALAILLSERPIRKAYGMPLEPTDKAVARLIFELGHHVTLDEKGTMKTSERIKEFYASCKENDELCYFWQFNAAFQNSMLYLISFNSKTFFDNVTPEQYRIFLARIMATRKAAHKLSEYDPELSSFLAFQEKDWGFDNVEEAEEALSNPEAGRKMIEKRKKDYVKYRDWALI